MSRTKYGKADTDEAAEAALSEFFADTDYCGHFDFGSVECNSLGRLLTAVAGMGGTVQIYSRAPDIGVKLFVRVGKRSKSYPFDNEEQFNEQIEMIANPWVAAFGKYLSLKNPTKPIAIDVEEGKKAKK